MTSPDMTTIFHARPLGRFIEIKNNLRRKELHNTNQGFNFFWRQFIDRGNVEVPIKLEEISIHSILRHFL